MATKNVVAYGDSAGVVSLDTAANPNTGVLRDGSGGAAFVQAAATELKSTALLTLANSATLSANTTLDATAVVWKFSTPTVNVTATLPPATGAAGRVYVIKKVDAAAHNVIVSDGTNTLATLSAQYATAIVQSDGTSWF